MKRQLFTILAFVSLAMMACKDELKQDKMSEQKLLADSTNFTTVKWLDSAVNFGTIKMGEKIEIKFRCLNTGNKPLIIISARPGCGCTVADYTKTPIAPGAQGLVTAAFDTKKTHGGTVTKYIIVTTNTKNGTENNLMFNGDISGGDNNDRIVVPHPMPAEKKN